MFEPGGLFMVRALSVSLTAILACACGPTASQPGGGGGGDGGGGGGGGDDEFADARKPGVCGEQDFAVEIAPPRLMILLDKSSSMADDLGNSGSKINQARAAIDYLIDRYQDRVLFGFDAFPSSGNCTVTDPIVRDTATSFTDNFAVAGAALGTAANGASTPMYCGLRILADPTYAPRFNDPNGNKYVILISDGADLCGDQCCVPLPTGFPPVPPAECVAAEDELADLASGMLATAGIRTFVIGFDDPSGDNVSESQLNAIAANGGTSYSSFLLASNQTQLEAAFDDIASQAVSCVLTLDDPGEEANPDEVNVYFDDVPVGFDEGCAVGTGWDWTDDTHTAVELCPAACAELQTLTVDNISVTFGCPSVIVE
jgi:hypothetical protein